MNRNANTHFNNNPTNINISRSVFNRDHSVKFSFNVGDIVPFLVDEVLPGDTVSIDTSKVIRLQPLVAPLMDEVFVDTYYFFVPNRLVWTHWQEFMGEREENSTEPPSLINQSLTLPYLYNPANGGVLENSVYDYMGIPCGVNISSKHKFNALPFRAYSLIYNDWFRPESFQNPVKTDKDNDGYNNFWIGQISNGFGGDRGACFKACKTFDYFTSCLPSPQKGPDVGLIMSGGTFPVYFGKTDNELLKSGKQASSYLDKYGYPHFTFQRDTGVIGDFSGNFFIETDTNGDMGVIRNSASSSGISNKAFLANALVDTADSTMTINELREAFAIQRYYEKAARGGSRYIELIKTFFGVTSPDARMQRSEYLGGNRIFLDINQVVQTSATEQDMTPQGNVAGMSLTNNHHSDFTKSFTEHGFLIGVCVARYHHTYQQGVERFWFRRSVFDFYNPTFANIGEQPVFKRELYLSGNYDQDNKVFGYNECWADYRYKPNRVCGEMRSNISNTLDCYHLADWYTNEPNLSLSWLQEDKTMLDRCLAVTSEVSNQIVADFYVKANWARCMPLYSIPGLLDHN